MRLHRRYSGDGSYRGGAPGKSSPGPAETRERAGMRLKLEKCAFLLKSVSYLGHVISEEGLHTAESKVEAVVEAPDPRDISELRSFLGMVNYYAKFLPNLATTLSPFYRLLRQTTAWHWGPKQ